MSSITAKKSGLFEGADLGSVFKQTIQRLNPAYQVRNPVMFVVFIGSIVTTLIFAIMLASPKSVVGTSVSGGQPLWFIGLITFWLWFTLLFANFAEAIAEGKGKAQADSLRSARKDVSAKKLDKSGQVSVVAANSLRKGDLVLIEAGDVIPADGQVIEGIASVDESAVTGESAPVIRESGGDRDAVTGGTRVLSDQIKVRVTSDPGESFLDRMIGLVESAKRQKTPNEIALSILLAALTIIFLLVCATLLPYSLFSVERAGAGSVITITVLPSTDPELRPPEESMCV